MGEKSVHLAELEVKAKQSALKRVADLFKKPEDLEKLTLVREQFNDQKVATEAQLTMALHNQLDGTQSGINKLDDAVKEAMQIKIRSYETESILNDLRGLSKELVETKNLAKKHSQLGSAMENMSYLMKTEELLKTAYDHIENDQFLEAHKIVQDMEGIRDVLMFEVSREKSVGDMETLIEYFKGLDNLNTIFVKKISMVGSRLFSAVISDGNMVIDCVRVIDREERADVIWQKRAERTGFRALGRPKQWKKVLFDAIAKTIHDKVFGSAMDDDDDKNKMVRHNEIIRQYARSDLKIAKNICPIYFPPDYNIFDRIVELYHNTIIEHVQALVSTKLEKKAVAQLLIWVNSYRTEEFMGDPFLNIDFKRLNLKYGGDLLPAEKIVEYSDEYVIGTMREFCSWSRNSLARYSQDWRKQILPELDGSSYYYTGLLSLVMTPLIELTGRGNLLRALGTSVRESFLTKFVDQMESFVSDYRGALRVYRQEYLEDRSRFHYYIEYMIANANDAHAFCATITEIIMEEVSDNPQLKAKLTSQINIIKNGFGKLADMCRAASEEVVMMDLTTVLSNVLTPKWLAPDDITANCFQGTLADYDQTLKYARPVIYKDMVNNIGEQLLLAYLKAILTRHCPFKSDGARRRAGEKIMMDGHMIHKYLRDGMNVREDLLLAYSCLSDIARLFNENDSSMLYLDTVNLTKRFPDLRAEQLAGFLLARGDVKPSQAKELATNSSNMSEAKSGVTSLNIFTKLATMMPS